MINRWLFSFWERFSSTCIFSCYFNPQKLTKLKNLNKIICFNHKWIILHVRSVQYLIGLLLPSRWVLSNQLHDCILNPGICNYCEYPFKVFSLLIPFPITRPNNHYSLHVFLWKLSGENLYSSNFCCFSLSPVESSKRFLMY